MARHDSLLDSARDYLQAFSIHALFEDLTTELIVERPKDPIEFIIQRLRDKQAARKTKEKPRIIFVVGGPGSGKSTQCAQLSEQAGCEHIHVAELIRAEAAASPLLTEAATILASQPNITHEGLLQSLPISTIVEFLRSKLFDQAGNPLIKNRTILLEGFPLTLNDAFQFERGICEIHSVLFLDCPEHILAERTARKLDTSTAGSFASILGERMELWRTKTRAIVEYYSTIQKVTVIDASKPLDNVWAQILPKFS